MSPKDCAYIVERLSMRFMAMVADHSRQLTEHRAAFGARTEADAKIIAGLRAEIGAARMAVLERDSLISERAKLQAMVKEQSDSAKAAGELLGWTANESPIQAVERVVKERDGLLTQVQDMRAEIERLQWENKTMHKDAEDGYAAAIKVLGDPVALSKERDALRAEVAALKSQNPKQHPVKAGEWVKASNGAVAQVLEVHKDWYLISRGHGWTFANCEPCDPPEAMHAEPDLTHLHIKGKEAWSDVPNATQWVEEMRGNTEAAHDTDAGKAAAESAAQHSAGIDIGTWSRKVTT